MEMPQIRYFIAVARTLNFTRAAEECNVAQPSLTRAIKNLEAELGGELFRRERASSHLTNLGRAMLPLLTQSYDSAVAAKFQADSYKKGDGVSVRMGLSRTADFDLVADAFSELERAFNNVQLSCQRGSADEILDQLRAGETEIALAGPINGSWERLDSWPLFVEDFHVVVNQQHRFAELKSIDLGDLVDERVIARPFCELWSETQTLLKAANVDAGRHYEVTSDRDAIRLIETGMGVGLLPASTRVNGELRKIALSNRIERTIRIYTVGGRERSPALSGLMNLLRSAEWPR